MGDEFNVTCWVRPNGWAVAGQFKSRCTDGDTGVSRSKSVRAEAAGQWAGGPTASDLKA